MDQTEDPKRDMPKDPSEEGSTKPGSQSGDQGVGSGQSGDQGGGMGQSGDQGGGSDMDQDSRARESESDKDDETR